MYISHDLPHVQVHPSKQSETNFIRHDIEKYRVR